jgi:hypothetical protein
MIILHVDPTTKNTDLYNKYINQGKDAFVLYYMEGCGPCNATRPEWKKIENVLENKYKNNDNIIICDIDQDCLKDIDYVPSQPSGFPTMVYLNKTKNIYENYEDSRVKNKDRSVDSFIEWIKEKVPSSQNGGKTKKRRRWSLKYKRSINCKRPRGFSQRQHCKYGRKKTKSKR